MAEKDLIAEIERAVTDVDSAHARVGLVFLDDIDAALRLTVAELAHQAGVSPATVVRFCQTLGYKGWRDLRLDLAQEASRRGAEMEAANIAEGRLNSSDSVATMMAKVAHHEATAIRRLTRQLDPADIDRVARALAQSERVIACGVGASALAASDLAQKLQRIGLDCLFTPDTHLQLVHAAMAPESSVAVGFSFSGRTFEVHRALQLARGRGGLAVAVTGDAASPVAQAADVVLLASARESVVRVGALASRLVQLAVVDFIFVRVAQLSQAKVAVAVEASRQAVGPQKMR
ncbi:MAG: MurR/RpiR family transcriptional regulator [Propionibacteriaceae bacterium]|nr:MurR/RpiR family transcriptional regulator [Propionibacteriaceae bacterium]